MLTQHPQASLTTGKPGTSDYIATEYMTGRVHWIHHQATQPRTGAPTLILVHGAGHNERVWQLGPNNWVQFFTRMGYNVVILSLTGHNPSEGLVTFQRLQRYVLDAHTPTEDLGLADSRVVYVGHSMGGIVVQMLLEQYPRTLGVVVVDSIAPHRAFSQYAPFLKHLARQHPLTFLASLVNPAAMFSSDALVRELLVGDEPSDALVSELQENLGGETSIAVIEMLALKHRGLTRLPGEKLLFISAQESAFFPPAECEASAREQGAQFVSVPGKHTVMLTASAIRAAQAIATFVESLPTQPQVSAVVRTPKEGQSWW
jgi:pimeloyl-ACP methyl ester carboxylesterase